ncbi:MAG: hypothetical protein Q4E61_01280 [Alphaproteobacteria bacterium]|nr:hypothetical protein [Alphaproteobacteria bacterium]
MLGFLWSIAMGIGAIVDSTKTSIHENKSREAARKNGNDYYVDSKGYFRGVNNNEKYYIGPNSDNGHYVVKDMKGRVIEDYTVKRWKENEKIEIEKAISNGNDYYLYQSYYSVKNGNSQLKINSPMKTNFFKRFSDGKIVFIGNVVSKNVENAIKEIFGEEKESQFIQPSVIVEYGSFNVLGFNDKYHNELFSNDEKKLVIQLINNYLHKENYDWSKHVNAHNFSIKKYN